MIKIRETYQFVELKANELEATIFPGNEDLYIEELQKAIDALNRLKEK